MPIAHSFQVINASFYELVNRHSGTFFHDLSVYRTAVLQEKPHVVNITAGLTGSLVHCHELVGKHILDNHNLQ